MNYIDLKKLARQKFILENPEYEIQLIWDNRDVIYGKMAFNVLGKSRISDDTIEKKIIVEV